MPRRFHKASESGWTQPKSPIASIAPTTPSPQTEDQQTDKTQAAADRDTSRQLWTGGLPNEIWLNILDYLCPHCCPPRPPLKPGFEFREKSYDINVPPGPLPHGARRDLLSMAMTCKEFRNLAQRYLFHCFDSPKALMLSQFRRTVLGRPDLAGAVREMTVSSNLDHRSILTHLGNIRILNFEVNHADLWAYKGGKSADGKVVEGLENLSHLTLKPVLDHGVLDVTSGRLWLENLMKGAPKVQRLRCHRLTDFSYDTQGQRLSWIPLNGFPNYAGLPENKITRLELVGTWLRSHSLGQLLQNFKELRELRLSQTNIPSHKDTVQTTRRPVDAHDVITLLEPLKQQLEVLELDLCWHPGAQSKNGSFRPIVSLADFTALKTLRLTQECIGHPPEVPLGDLPMPEVPIESLDLSGLEAGFEAISEYFNKHRAGTEDYLIRLLPLQSLEFLQIDEYHGWDEAVVGLARHASRGGCPKLKHVRLGGTRIIGLDYKDSDDSIFEDSLEEFHGLKSLVPREYWDDAEVDVAMNRDECAWLATHYFQRAGVRFERLELNWYVRANDDSRTNDGWMIVYPQPCAGGCRDPDCVMKESQMQELIDDDSESED